MILFWDNVFMVGMTIYCVLCKISSPIFREQKSILFHPEKLAFLFLIDFETFVFFHFSLCFVPEDDFVAILTIFLSFYEAPHGKRRLL